MAELLSKFKGVIVGGAIGDAIGKSLEDVTQQEAFEYYGSRVEGYCQPHPLSPSAGMEPESISDETTISLLLVESIVDKGALSPEDFFLRLRRWSEKEDTHRYPDPALLTAIDLLSRGVSLEEAGLLSSSVEGVLRCTVTGLFHFYNPLLAAEAGRLVSLMTHRSKEIYDGSAMVSGLVSLLMLHSTDLSHPEGRLKLLEQLKGFIKYRKHQTYLEKLAELLLSGAGLEDAIYELGNSTHVFESLSLSIFLLLRFADEPLEALWNAVNACGAVGGDTDAIGYLVGSFLGAYWGLEVFPEELVENLENSEYHISLAEKLYDTTMEFLERRS